MREVDEALARALLHSGIKAIRPRVCRRPPTGLARDRPALPPPATRRSSDPGRSPNSSGRHSCSLSSASGDERFERMGQLLLDGAAAAECARSFSSRAAIAPKAERPSCSPWRGPSRASRCARWSSMPT